MDLISISSIKKWLETSDSANPRAGGSGDTAGLKCQALTSDESRQCRGFVGVFISRQYTVTLIQIR